MLSYRGENMLQGGLVMAKSGRLEPGDNIYGHHRSIFNYCDAFGQQHKQEAQLSQRDRAAACLNFGKNISAKSVHLTLLYVTSLTSTNHHLLFYGIIFVLNAKLISI